MAENNKEWQVKCHSWQIADTGDYDGQYEITNGEISFFTQDEDEGDFKEIVKALNASECKFYLDDGDKMNLYLADQQVKQAKDIISTLEEYAKVLEEDLHRVASVFENHPEWRFTVSYSRREHLDMLRNKVTEYKKCCIF